MEKVGLNRAFWQGKRVFLTGHTGFKGAWLSLWLKRLGADVTGFALEPPTSPSLFALAKVSAGLNSVIGDIRDLNHVKSAMFEAQPEVVIHMAAQSLVLQSYNDPLETYMTNVMGTAHVFEAARACDPYSSSKACSELVTTTYRNCFIHKQHGALLASARAGNVIGGGDWADNRLVPDLLRSIIAGESVVIRSPKAIRPWQHVLEPLSGYLKLVEHLGSDEGEKYASGWNFGPYDNDAKPVEWIISSLCEKWGQGASWQLDDPNKVQHHEANYLKLDCSKASVELGWTPSLGLDVALDWIVDWYRCFVDNEDIQAETLKQIAAYEERMQ